MATTETTFTPAAKPFPYIGVGVPAAQLITPIPSAEVVFTIDGGAVTVAAAGASQKIEINCILPRSFCWVLAESSFFLRGASVDDWDDECRCSLRDANTNADTTMPIEYAAHGLGHNSATDFSKTYVANHIPQKMVISRMETDPRLQIELWDVVIDGVAAVIHFYARFFRYDRIQSQYWMVNTPVLTR